MSGTQKPIRWWLLFVIIAVAILSILIIQILDMDHRQSKVFWTAVVVVLTTVLGVLWLLGFSRLRWRVKLTTLAIVILGIFLGVNLFQFKGFSGDLVPIFEWRWQDELTTLRQDSGNISDPQISIADYPQFLGQHRNGVVTGIKLNLDWDTHPPKLVWRQPIGAGWSGFAVVGNSAITQEQEGDWEKVVCYELHTGEVKWSHKDQARYDMAPAGLGPRATPTISGNRVYTVGSTGILNCLDFETGKPLWTTNTFEDNKADIPAWGVSVSPLVSMNLLSSVPVVQSHTTKKQATSCGQVTEHQAVIAHHSLQL